MNDAPILFQPGTGSPIRVNLETGRDDVGSDNQTAGGQGIAITGQAATIMSHADLLEDQPRDPEAARMARLIARRLSIRRPRSRRVEHGAGKPVSVRYHNQSDEIDLDRTLEVLTEHPRPEDTNIIVRDRDRSRHAVVLVVDVSGSMRGEKLRIAAATVAALSNEVPNDQLGLVAFWSDAALLKPFNRRASASILLGELCRIPPRGLTNIHFALAVVQAELARTSAPRRSVILLSDSVHNAGPDPRLLASKIPRLHLLLQVDGEHDAPLGKDLARLGHGSLEPIATHRDVAPALNRVLAPYG